MIINIVSVCDSRPVIYTFLKLCQTLGDVLFVSNNKARLRLADTGETGGHYQNTMIAIAEDSLDEFIEDFPYRLDDFDYIITENLPYAMADLTVLVEGCQPLSEEDLDDLVGYFEDYKVISLFKHGMLPAKTFQTIEWFEASRNMPPIGEGIANSVANILAPLLNFSAKNLASIAMSEKPGVVPKKKMMGGVLQS